jgi:hypothetical protein
VKLRETKVEKRRIIVENIKEGFEPSTNKNFDPPLICAGSYTQERKLERKIYREALIDNPSPSPFLLSYFP